MLSEVIVRYSTYSLYFLKLLSPTRWLSKHEDDGAIERDLYPVEDSTKYLAKVPYQVELTTSDITSAGLFSTCFNGGGGVHPTLPARVCFQHVLMGGGGYIRHYQRGFVFNMF